MDCRADFDGDARGQCEISAFRPLVPSLWITNNNAILRAQTGSVPIIVIIAVIGARRYMATHSMQSHKRNYTGMDPSETMNLNQLQLL
jgi:hypothetical protein